MKTKKKKKKESPELHNEGYFGHARPLPKGGYPKKS